MVTIEPATLFEVMNGAPGRAVVWPAADGADAGLVPAAFVAVIVKA
jgi:hypothetical protein